MKLNYVEKGELEDGLSTLPIGYCVYLCVSQANVAMRMNWRRKREYGGDFLRLFLVLLNTTRNHSWHLRRVIN